MNFHDIEITVYKGVRDTIGHRSTLFKFLENVEYDAIQELRSTTDANLKKQTKLSLPQATISGVFAPTRSAENLVKHSGLICVDIDRKDNLHITNFDTLITDVLSHIEEVAYASRSVSGNGYFVIIPLKYPEEHKAQFEKLIRVFDEMGITIDKACGDVCRLRCQSYDIHQYVNMSAKPFSGIYREPKSIFPKYTYDYDEFDMSDMNVCIMVNRDTETSGIVPGSTINGIYTPVFIIDGVNADRPDVLDSAISQYLDDEIICVYQYPAFIDSGGGSRAIGINKNYNNIKPNIH